VKILVALVMALSGTVLTVAPAEARPLRAVTLGTPTVSTDGTVVWARGRVKGDARRVRVEMRRNNSGWQLLGRAKVRHRKYAAAFSTAEGTLSLRVGTRGVYSTSRTVTVSRPKPATDACGARPAKPDGSLWACSFVDDFSASSLDRTKWQVQTNASTGVDGARSCAVDDGSTVQVANGVLNLVVRKLATPMTCYASTTKQAQFASGAVSTYHLFSQKYGRFEARIKNAATTLPGLQESFWLWPDDRDASWTASLPWTGEIDISETYSQHPSLSIPYLHYSADVNGPVPGLNTAWNCAAARGVWNTYRLDWTPSRLELSVNGKTCLVNTSGDSAFEKSYIVAITAALGVGANAYTGGATMPATTSVDYVRVWR
jgi:beta-glucanase (GH16 family)